MAFAPAAAFGALLGYGTQRAVGVEGQPPAPAAAPSTPAPVPMRGSPASYQLEQPANADFPARNWFMPWPVFGPGEVLAPHLSPRVMAPAVEAFSAPANEQGPINRLLVEALPAVLTGAAHMARGSANPRTRMLAAAGTALTSYYVGSEMAALHQSMNTPREAPPEHLVTGAEPIAGALRRTARNYRATGQEPQATVLDHQPPTSYAAAAGHRIATNRMPGYPSEFIVPPDASASSTPASSVDTTRL